MPDGSLICVKVKGGITEPHNKNIVVICRSNDGGKSWSAPEILFKHKNRGVWATEIFTGFDRPMMVLYTYNADKLVYLAYEDGVSHFLNKYTFEELGV